MYYLGVDVGGTNIAVGIVDENNAIIAKASIRRPFRARKTHSAMRFSLYATMHLQRPA